MNEQTPTASHNMRRAGLPTPGAGRAMAGAVIGGGLNVDWAP